MRTGAGRLWLGRFLVAVRPRWSMRDQLRSEEETTSEEAAVAEEEEDGEEEE